MQALKQNIRVFHHYSVVVILAISTTFTPAFAKTIAALDVCSARYAQRLAPETATLYVGRDAELKKGQLIKSSIDDILLIKPDLVLRQWGGGVKLLPVLTWVSIPYLQLGTQPEMGAIRTELSAVMDRLDASDQQIKLAEFDAKLSKLREKTKDIAHKPSILYINPSGVSAGLGTSIDMVIREAGLINYGADYQGWFTISLENLLINPPDFFMTAFYDQGQSLIQRWAPMRQFMLDRHFADIPVISFPGDSLSCNDWTLLDVAWQLHQQVYGERR